MPAPFAATWDGTSWVTQNVPVPPDTGVSWLGGVSCASPTACMVVGLGTQNGTDIPVAERWDGSAWTTEHPLVPDLASRTWFDGVACASANDCVAVGAYWVGDYAAELPLIEHWNGLHWDVAHVAFTPSTDGEVELHAVSCTSLAACTAVGDVGPTAGASPLVERWDGVAWVQQKTAPSARVSALRSVSCASATACTAAGYFYDAAVRGNPLTPAAERWDGTSWTNQPPLSDSQGGQFNAVSCPTPATCIAGGSSPLLERWQPNGGWAFESVEWPSSISNINSVDCPKANVCTAVGQYYSSAGGLPLVLRLS